MISATPALSSAPSNVSPDDVTTSWPAGASTTVPPRGSSIGAAGVGAVDDRLDARTGRVRTRVDVGDQPDRRPVAASVAVT